MQYACAQYVYATFSSTNGDATTGYMINGLQLVAPEYHTIKYYDDYSYKGLASVSPYSNALSAETMSGYESVWENVPVTKDISVRGQLTGERVFRLNGDGEVITVYYYNQLDYPVQVVSYDTAVQCYNRLYANYTHGGAPTKEKRVHSKGGNTYNEEKSYTYDNMGRVTSLSHSYNGRPSVTLLENHYDGIGRLSKVSYHDGCDSVSYSYNVRNKLVSISSIDFNQNLYYATGPGTPRYNDFVSSLTWQNGEFPVQGYMFEYDPSGNLTNSIYGEGNALALNCNRYSESLLTYDRNGNILQFKRWGMTGDSTFGLVDDVCQQYDGNLLYSSNDLIADMSGQTGVYNRFSDNRSVECDYVYDANGNMIADANRGMSLTYNCLALPEAISVSGQGTISNCYDALGAKKSLTYVNGVDTTKVEYLDGVIYKDGLPKQVLTETGYLSLEDNVYRFYIKDYLGSIRLVKNNTGAVEEINNYYPSGALFTVPVPDVQDYKYSGKELVDYADLVWYDYGARYYDPVLLRWHSADPLLEKYYDTSPYSFCSNNFVNFVDPDGKAYGDFYTYDGRYITSDAFDDGKVYLVTEQAVENYRRNFLRTSDMGYAVQELKRGSEEVGGLIIQNRFEETDSYTTSTFETVGGDDYVSGYILEPAGPSTITPNQNKRVPEGLYNLDKHSGKKYSSTFVLYNSLVPKERSILYHAGNTSADTRGCMLPGDTYSGSGFVGKSGAKFEELKRYINSVGPQNVRVIIKNNVR